MTWLPKSLSLPLLAKELVEQAARRRTYVARVAYAALLFLAFAIYFHSEVPREGSPYRTLGIGKQMFEFLVWVQFAGVYFFLPAMMSGVLTYEKERRSLELVFLTDLGPWEILLQKYLGRLVPMFTFLLLSLPLMAIAYAFGGVSADYLASGVFILVLTCLQVGAFALMVSAFCRTTTQAFVGSYVFLALFYFLPLLAALLLKELGLLSLPISEKVIFAFLPVYVFDMISRRGFDDTLAHGVPIALSAGAFLALARVFIVRRAFVPAKSLTLGLFKLVDGVMDRWNRSVGNVVLVKEKSTLPGDDPVAWREVAKKSLGKTRYLIRILFATEVPILFTAVMVIGGSRPQAGGEALAVMVFILWGLAALAVSVPSANAIASERTKRTLEVLLTTPLEGADIIRQKARAMWRLIIVLMVPFATLFLIEAWWESTGYRRGGRAGGELGAVGYLVTSGLTIVIYLPMLSWVSRWIGLRVRSRARAVAATLGGLVSWCTAPLGLVLGVCALTGTDPDSSGLAFLFLLSPATVIPLTELADKGLTFRGTFHAPAAVPIFLNFLWHGGVLYYFRHLCLKHADRYLGRVGERKTRRRVFARLRGSVSRSS